MKYSSAHPSAKAVILTFLLTYGAIGLGFWLVDAFRKPNPPRYVLTETELKMWSGKWVVIPRDSITRVWFAHPSDGHWTCPGFRGQLLDYARCYWFPETGEIEVYADVIDTLVVLETPKGRYGLSPYNPTYFAAQLEHGATGTYLVRPAPPLPWYWSDTAVAVYTLVAIGAISAPLAWWRLRHLKRPE